MTDIRSAYKVVIEPLSEEDGGGYLATVPELPGCMSDGESRAEALRNVEDAIATWLHCARKMGGSPPHPSSTAPPDPVAIPRLARDRKKEVELDFEQVVRAK